MGDNVILIKKPTSEHEQRYNIKLCTCFKPFYNTKMYAYEIFYYRVEPFKGNASSRNRPAPDIKFTYSTYSQEGAISPNCSLTCNILKIIT